MSHRTRPAFNVCVFGGASPEVRPELFDAARALGRALAQAGMGVVYGGGSTGMMGAVADGALEAGGWVEGVVPEGLFPDYIIHQGLSQVFYTPGMHARKATMAERADAFVALPGGFGTLEELFEVTTWAQIGLHARPMFLLNVGGFYDGLIAFVDFITAERFVAADHRAWLGSCSSPQEVVPALRAFVPPTSGGRWEWLEKLANRDQG